MPKFFAICAALLVAGRAEDVPQQHGNLLRMGRIPVLAAFMCAGVAEDTISLAIPAKVQGATLIDSDAGAGAKHEEKNAVPEKGKENEKN